MKMEGFPSTWCPPRLVIPAPWSTAQNSTGGIQVCCAELAWIPAFAGMTEPRRASWFSSPNGYFQRRTRRARRKEHLTAKSAKDTKNSGVGFSGQPPVVARSNAQHALSSKTYFRILRAFVVKKVLSKSTDKD